MFAIAMRSEVPHFKHSISRLAPAHHSEDQKKSDPPKVEMFHSWFREV
jgi:hypothetical protein